MSPYAYCALISLLIRTLSWSVHDFCTKLLRFLDATYEPKRRIIIWPHCCILDIFPIFLPYDCSITQSLLFTLLTEICSLSWNLLIPLKIQKLQELVSLVNIRKHKRILRWRAEVDYQSYASIINEGYLKVWTLQSIELCFLFRDVSLFLYYLEGHGLVRLKESKNVKFMLDDWELIEGKLLDDDFKLYCRSLRIGVCNPGNRSASLVDYLLM